MSKKNLIKKFENVKNSVINYCQKNLYIKTVAEKIIKDDFPGMAAEMAFMFALGIFPFLSFLMVVFGWLGKKSLMTTIMELLSKVIPNASLQLIDRVLQEVMSFQNGGLIATFVFFIIIGLASNAIAVIIKGLNRAYRIKETRNFLWVRTLSVLMVFVNAFFLFISINLIILGKVFAFFIIAHNPFSEIFINIMLIARWPITFLFLYLMTSMNYYLLPAVHKYDKIKRISILPGTLFFSIFWLVGSGCFSVYLNHLNTYNKVYGPLGAFAILMVWLYYTSLLILIGGEINSQVYKKLVKDGLRKGTVEKEN